MQQKEDLESVRQQRLLDEIERISGLMNVSAQDDIATLSERVFEFVFLPLFAGDEKLQYEVTLATWTNYAGGPYKPMNIIDATGKIIFQVPPIFDRSTINPISNNSLASISHVVTSAGQLSNVHPSQGLYYLDAELTKRATIMKVPANVAKDLDTWNKIYLRYGRPQIMAMDSSTGDVAGPGDKEGILDYDFEPL